jgi:hypothetical protein
MRYLTTDAPYSYLKFVDHNMGFEPFYGKGPRPLLWVSSRAAPEKITSGVPNRLNFCVLLWYIHNVHTWPRSA